MKPAQLPPLILQAPTAACCRLLLLMLLLLLLIGDTSGQGDFKAVAQVECPCTRLPLTEKPMSKGDCVLTCLANPKCRSMRFNDSSGQCEHSESTNGCFHYIANGSVLYQKTSTSNDSVPQDNCIIQRRSTPSLSFARPWADYVTGFGDEKNFWLGLDKIHALTSGGGAKLKVNMGLGSDYHYCEYHGFSVGGSDTNYRMDYNSYRPNGLTGDSLNVSRLTAFSTSDRSLHGGINGSCSFLYGGSGWWFGRLASDNGSGCADANPNGVFNSAGETGSSRFVVWRAVSNEFMPLKWIHMSVKPLISV